MRGQSISSCCSPSSGCWSEARKASTSWVPGERDLACHLVCLSVLCPHSERLMGLMEEILRACTPGSDEQAQADSPGALTEAITATATSAPAATPAATPATNATTRPLEQRMACDLAELDPLAWIRAAGVPPLASASIVIERLEVSLLGETTHASQPGDASSSSLQPAADERKPLPFISSERILVAVLEEVDAIRLTYHLVGSIASILSPHPRVPPIHPLPGLYGFCLSPGCHVLIVALPGRLCSA